MLGHFASEPGVYNIRTDSLCSDSLWDPSDLQSLGELEFQDILSDCIGHDFATDTFFDNPVQGSPGAQATHPKRVSFIIKSGKVVTSSSKPERATSPANWNSRRRLVFDRNKDTGIVQLTVSQHGGVGRDPLLEKERPRSNPNTGLGKENAENNLGPESGFLLDTENKETGDQSEQELLDLLEDYNTIKIKDLQMGDQYQDKCAQWALDSKVDYIHMIQKQWNQHFQLLVQLFAVSFHVAEGEAISKTVLDLLFDIRNRCDRAFETMGQCLFERKQPELRSIRTLYQVPGTEKLGIFKCFYDRQKYLDQYSCHFPLEPERDDQNVVVLGLDMVSLTQDIINVFRDHSGWDSELKLALLSERGHTRLKFTESEDRLLLRGLRQYGTNNWKLIQQQYLPAKKEKQIAIRYKNLISRTAPNNPVKRHYFEQFLPLSRPEEEQLLYGVQAYGDNFAAISKAILPHRSPQYLKRFWLDKFCSA